LLAIGGVSQVTVMGGQQAFYGFEPGFFQQNLLRIVNGVISVIKGSMGGCSSLLLQLTTGSLQLSPVFFLESSRACSSHGAIEPTVPAQKGRRARHSLLSFSTAH
jgi:hypothetical protein